MKYLKQYKQFEAGDRVKYKGKELFYNDNKAFPFVIDENNDEKIYFGNATEMHSYIYGRINSKEKIIDVNDDYRTAKEGRIWLDQKVIGFWLLETDDFSGLIKKIQDAFNDMHGKKYGEIDLFDGEWQVEVPDWRVDDEYKNPVKYKDYMGYDKILLPITDYIRLNNNQAEIEEDDEEYQQHLARAKK